MRSIAVICLLHDIETVVRASSVAVGEVEFVCAVGASRAARGALRLGMGEGGRRPFGRGVSERIRGGAGFLPRSV